MSFPSFVKLVEVGPRDGLQNEPNEIPTETKLEFIRLLNETGLSVIEATSFVSPKWVPQLADHADILKQLPRQPRVHYPVLVPNVKGMENALAVGVRDVAVFVAASETFSQKNINCSIAESLARCKEVIDLAKDNHVHVRGYVSCVLGCPYEGDIDIEKVSEVAGKLYQLGCYEVSLGDTIGVGTPKKAQHLIQSVQQRIPTEHIAIHFHDTYGQALANIYACLQLGVSVVDASVGGLGGCPYAPSAGGNVATEDVLYMLNGLGIETGVDMKALIDADVFIHNALERKTRSKVALSKLTDER